MATLVFTAVGQALGGPMGAALGSIIGRSVDESLFGPGPRKGPRLGDLSVQTSSYSTMIPRIYGTMRVAGTVVWSTDLIEEETVTGGGKGSAPTQGYAYSVSLAVALSSRPIRSVGRIWADGKLVRGSEGDLKVRAELRILTGSEDQAVDPVIASVETIAETPAYRGVALAIFEGLQLSEFGNRIPQFSFEVTADDGNVARSVLADVAGMQAEGVDISQALVGYAAYGDDKRHALEPVVEVCAIDLCDDGSQLRVVDNPSARLIGEEELGCSADDERHEPMQRRRDAARQARSLAMQFYDPSRDFQSGQARVVSGVGGTSDDTVELAAAIAAADAKGLAEALMRRRNADADTIVVRLPPHFFDLVPGRVVDLGQRGCWRVVSQTIEASVVIAELSRVRSTAPSLPSDGGRATIEADLLIGESHVALFEPPNGVGDDVLVAVSNRGLWKAVPVYLSLNGQAGGSTVARRRATLGVARSLLSPGQSTLVDRRNELIVELHDPGQLLLNADVAAIDAGANLAMLGDELIQFAEAADIGSGFWRLRNFLRGCRGTEWAMAGHSVGEAFSLLNASMVPIDSRLINHGGTLRASARGIGDRDPWPTAERSVAKEADRPPSPCRLQAAVAGSLLEIQWVARSWAGFGWGDEVDPADMLTTVTLRSGTWERIDQLVGTSIRIPLADIPAGNSPLRISAQSVVDGRASRLTESIIYL